MNKKTLPSSCFFCSYLLASMVLADDKTTKEPLPDEITSNPPARLDTRTGFVGSGIEIFADGDTSSVSFAITRDWDEDPDDLLGSNLVSLKLATPFNKRTESGDFVTETGLTNSTSLELSYSALRMNNPEHDLTQQKREELLKRGRTICKETNQTTAGREECSKSTMNGVKKYLPEEDRKLLNNNKFFQENIWIYGISGALGYENFEFRDSGDFSEKEEDEVPYSLSVFAGMTPDSRPIYFGIGYEYKVEFDSADEQTLCPSSGGSGNQECFTSSFSKADKDKDSIFFVLTRFQKEISLKKIKPLPIGVEIKAAYDTVDDVFGVSLPLYMFLDDEKSLRGGFRTSWESDNEDIKFGVFIGSSFSLF